MTPMPMGPHWQAESCTIGLVYAAVQEESACRKAAYGMYHDESTLEYHTSQDTVKLCHRNTHLGRSLTLKCRQQFLWGLFLRDGSMVTCAVADNICQTVTGRSNHAHHSMPICKYGGFRNSSVPVTSKVSMLATSFQPSSRGDRHVDRCRIDVSPETFYQEPPTLEQHTCFSVHRSSGHRYQALTVTARSSGAAALGSCANDATMAA